MGICTAFIRCFAEVRMRHAFILLQPSRTVFKVHCDDLATRRHLCIDKLLAEAQSLVTTQLELTTHGTVL